MVACNCSPKGWIAAANKKGPSRSPCCTQAADVVSVRPPWYSDKGCWKHQVVTVKGPGNGPGHCPKHFGQPAARTARPRTGGMHSCLYPSPHGYANLRWQTCLRPIARTCAMRHLAVSRRKSHQLQWRVNRPLALAARGGWHQQRRQQQQGKPGPEQAAQPQRPGAGKGHQLLQLQWPHASAARATQKVQGSFSGEGPQGLGHRIRHHFRCKRQIMHRAGTRLRVSRVQAAKGLGCCWRVRAKARWQKGCASLSVVPFSRQVNGHLLPLGHRKVLPSGAGDFAPSVPKRLALTSLPPPQPILSIGGHRLLVVAAALPWCIKNGPWKNEQFLQSSCIIIVHHRGKAASEVKACPHRCLAAFRTCRRVGVWLAWISSKLGKVGPAARGALPWPAAARADDRKVGWVPWRMDTLSPQTGHRWRPWACSQRPGRSPWSASEKWASTCPFMVHPSMRKKAEGSRPAEEPSGPHHRPPWQSQEAQQLPLRQRQPESCYAAAAAALHRPASHVMGPWLNALQACPWYYWVTFFLKTAIGGEGLTRDRFSKVCFKQQQGVQSV